MTVPWSGSDPSASHPLIPKTLFPLSSLALLLCGLISPFHLLLLLPAGHPRSIGKKKGIDKGTRRAWISSVTGRLIGWQASPRKDPFFHFSLQVQGLFLPDTNNARKVQVQIKITHSLHWDAQQEKYSGYLWALSQHETIYTRLIECWQCVWLCGRQTETASASRDWQST